MVHCWRKLCSENRWTRQQSYLASEHYSRKNCSKAFSAFREGSGRKRRSQSRAAAFHEQALQKKTLRGLSEAQSNYWRHHEKQCLAKSFRAVKRYHDIRKVTKRMYNGAQSFYSSNLKRQALSGLYKHREHLKMKLSRQAAALYHWKRHTKSRILKYWAIIVRRISDLREKGDHSRIQLLKALLKRCMKNWLLVTQDVVTARQGIIAQTSQRLNKSRKTRVLRAWSQRSREKHARRLKSEQVAVMRNDRTSASVTNALRKYASEKREKRAKVSVAFSFRRKQALTDAISVWKAYQAKKETAGAAALKALAHLKQNLTRKSLAAWRPWHERHMSKKQDREKALDIYKSVSYHLIS